MTPKGIIDQYLNSIHEIVPDMTYEEAEFFASGLTVSEYPSKYLFIKKDEYQDKIGYVFSGLMRAFYIDEEGDEINVSFISEGNFAVHFAALTQHKPSKYYFQAIESVVIINLSYRHLIECCERFHSIERYLRIMMGRELVFKQERIDSFIFDNAETRYLNFIKDNPSLYNRISLTQLSSYLGIERQTLTRIRKKLLDN